MTYIKLTGEPNGDGGDMYTGLDRFNRVIDVRWINASNTDVNRFKYGFSRAGNRLWRQNPVAPSGGFDEQYGYDGLYQITDRKQGTLNSSHVIPGTPVQEEQFTFDPTGNWPSYLLNQSGTTVLNQTRTHQKVNEITAISGSSTGYDANGNLTTMPQIQAWGSSQAVTWDAWNRLVSVSASGTALGTYQYDGLNRRTTKVSLEGGSSTTRHFYYSNQWQVLEERVNSSTSADVQYVWGIKYQDDLALRDKFGVSSQRFYSLADYFQPTAIADTTGAVQERYSYTASGQVSYLTASFTSRSSSSYGWEILFGAYYFDVETGLYQVRNRFYHCGLGRWLSRDPLKNAERSQGANLYWYVSNNAVNYVDPTGMDTITITDNDGILDISGLVGHVLGHIENWITSGGANTSSTGNQAVRLNYTDVCPPDHIYLLSVTASNDWGAYQSGPNSAYIDVETRVYFFGTSNSQNLNDIVSLIAMCTDCPDE